MILVDTSVWIDHLRRGDTALANMLENGWVLVHPFVVGEIALGNLRPRRTILEDLSNLERPVVASDEEVLGFIDRWRLHGRGIGYVDTHLLAATRLTTGASLWTRDKKLSAVADALSLSASV